MTILIRMICLAVGYVFGLFQTGYLYGRKQGVDIRKEGSGNSGATNSLRVFGIKAGVIVFAGDMLKTLIPCLIARAIFRESAPDMAYLYMLYTGFGAVLGHNYPFYMNFKGGKGISCTAGLALAVNWKVALCLFVLFLLIVGVTKFVSLASLVAVTGVLITMIVMATSGALGLGHAAVIEFIILGFLWAALAFFRHRANIGRLIAGNENKTYLFGKKKD